MFAFLRSITEGVDSLDLTAGGTAAMVSRTEKGKEFSDCGIIMVCGGSIFVDFFLGVIHVPMNSLQSTESPYVKVCNKPFTHEILSTRINTILIINPRTLASQINMLSHYTVHNED